MTISSLIRLILRFAARLGWEWWMCSLFATASTAATRAFRLRHQKNTGIRVIASGLLSGYLVLVYAFTVLGRTTRVLSQPINLNLLDTITQRLTSSYNRYELILNVVLFIPIGFLTPLTLDLSCLSVTLVSMLLSAAIELGQYALSCGTCEASDVFCNVLGAMMGFALLRVVRAYVRNNR